MTDPESLIKQIKQAGHEVSETMHFGDSDYPVKAIPYAKFLEVLSVFEATYRAEVRAGVVAEEPEWEYRVVLYETDSGRVWDEKRTDDQERAEAMFSGWVDAHYQDATDTFEIQRRRKGGPWVPVEQGDDDA